MDKKMEERLNELVQNEVFMRKLLALDDAVEIQELLAENDVEMSLEEIALIKKHVEAHLNGNEELSEDELANVVGGGFVTIFTAIITGIVTLGKHVHVWTGGRW